LHPRPHTSFLLPLVFTIDFLTQQLPCARIVLPSIASSTITSVKVKQWFAKELKFKANVTEGIKEELAVAKGDIGELQSVNRAAGAFELCHLPTLLFSLSIY
jgi:hypothetical protein